ncbi:DUF4435 domain-containing protein [Aquabacterium sp.]|uniref:DUF4435 domain-containing protein n=1 Tax=Aquabacterium sp. TaxID=1872578 RepID=UPI0024890AAD|nr:DUF4435 domain-containing protein [Aquabacterium sp.]MDI1258601.1 DUF4435 domain-containing protein [Aquabacterium sp.]
MNKYEPDELLNLAIMSKTPYVIVEGVDDLRIYEGVANSANIVCEIYSVDMLEGLSGGNDGVVQALKNIEALAMPAGKSAGQYIVGIIDRDAKYFRGEIPALASIFSLNYYSIESHFVNKFSIRSVVNRLTRSPSAIEIDVESIYLRVEEKVYDVYYFSLDALKGAVDPGYQSIIGYSSSVGRRKDKKTIADLQLRKADLDAFAAVFRLTPKIDSLRLFVKGKWLLTVYAEELFFEIEQLVSKCKNSAILQCRVCKYDNRAPCLFQMRDGLNKKSLYTILQDFFEMPEFEYIRDKLKLVAGTAAL